MIKDDLTIHYDCDQQETIAFYCTSDANCTSSLFNKCAIYYYNEIRDLYA